MQKHVKKRSFYVKNRSFHAFLCENRSFYAFLCENPCILCENKPEKKTCQPWLRKINHSSKKVPLSLIPKDLAFPWPGDYSEENSLYRPKNQQS